MIMTKVACGLSFSPCARCHGVLCLVITAGWNRFTRKECALMKRMCSDEHNQGFMFLQVTCKFVICGLDFFYFRKNHQAKNDIVSHGAVDNKHGALSLATDSKTYRLPNLTCIRNPLSFFNMSTKFVLFILTFSLHVSPWILHTIFGI